MNIGFFTLGLLAICSGILLLTVASNPLMIPVGVLIALVGSGTCYLAIDDPYD